MPYGSGSYGTGTYGLGSALGDVFLDEITLDPWTFVVCDTSGNALGQPVASGRQLSIGLSKTSTASFRVRTGTQLWREIVAGGTTLKVYDSAGALRFFGDIVSDELVASGQGGSIQVQAADLSFRLSKRYTGKDVTGIGNQYTATDPAAIVTAVLAAVNAEKATGVTIGTTGTFIVRTITVLWTRVLDLISQLGSIAGSYEWTLRYTDGTPPTVNLDLLAVTGTDRTADVFLEYGIGRNNCNGYQRVRTIDTMATRVFGLGSGSTITAEAYDTGAESVRRFEDVLNIGDITDAALLDALASAHVAIRRVPRRTVNFTPFPHLAPQYGVHWFLGDTVTGRACVDNYVDTNGSVRIWSAEIAVDEFGMERSTLTVEPT